jgi:hypothetical protein
MSSSYQDFREGTQSKDRIIEFHQYNPRPLLILDFPDSADGLWNRYVTKPNARITCTVPYPRIIPKDDECAAKLKKRTLKNLYNERPAWLANAQKKLEEAVFAAYDWPPDLSDDALLAKLLALNLERASGPRQCAGGDSGLVDHARRETLLAHSRGPLAKNRAADIALPTCDLRRCRGERGTVRGAPWAAGEGSIATKEVPTAILHQIDRNRA